MSSSMITLSVVIYIIFLLTSTSLFVVANTTIEPYLDGEYVKKNITIDPEHLKSRLEKVIEHDKTSHKREDANGFIEERNLLSSRNELLQGQQKWGWGRRVMTKAKKHVKKAASGVKKTVTKAASAVKTHVKKAASAVKNKFNTNNDVTWEEPAKGTKFGVAMPGGGVKSIFAILPLNFMQKFVLEIIDEDYDDQGNVIYGKAVKPNAGWANLKDMIFNGGMMGAWPGVGSATQIDMGNLGTSTPLQFSYADGGYADNYGIAAQLRQMSVTGKIHPFVSVISMSSYKGFTQFFSKRLCPYSAGLMQCAGTTKPVDDYTIATYQQPNLIMFEGLPFDGPSKTCQKNPTKKECPTVVPVKSDLVTVENKYFGIKGGMKVKIIFLFYNPGELTLLPSSTKRKEILESASRLTTVLEDADVLKYLI